MKQVSKLILRVLEDSGLSEEYLSEMRQDIKKLSALDALDWSMFVLDATKNKQIATAIGVEMQDLETAIRVNSLVHSFHFAR